MSTEQVDARPFLASALVTAIDHIGIAVPNLDEAIAWQEKAVALGGEIEGLRETLQKYLLERDGESSPAQPEGEESE